MRAIEPIDHRPVYRPIETRPVRKPELPEPRNALQDMLRDIEAERIWQITRQTAIGTNMPVKQQDRPPIEYVDFPITDPVEYQAPNEDAA